MVNKVRSRERILDNYTSIQWCCQYATCLRSSKCCCCFALWSPLLLLLRMPYLPLNKTVTFISRPKLGLLLTLLTFLYFCLCISIRLDLTPPSCNMRKIVSGL